MRSSCGTESSVERRDEGGDERDRFVWYERPRMPPLQQTHRFK